MRREDLKNQPFLGSQIVVVVFLTLMGAFGLNLAGGSFLRL